MAFIGLIGSLLAANGTYLFSEIITPIYSTMFECTGGGNETFGNIPASSSAYSTRTWTGDNGLAWSATDSRTDQTLNGKAITLRTSTLKNTAPAAGGVGTISFKYKRVFTGNSTLKLYVNGVQYGGDIAVTSETVATFSQAVNVSGNATIEIKNSGNRTVIDDVVWNCYTVPVTGPELQLADASGTNKECGSLSVDFGSHPVNVYTDAVFTVKNTGTSTLNVSALTLSDTTNFQVISPSLPFTVSASSSAIVLVRFESATAGVKTSTLTVVNDDTNEGNCVVNLTGSAVAPCTAPVITEASVAADSITASSANIAVTGAIADGYLAVVTNGAALSMAPADAATYAVNDVIGNGTVVYNGTAATFALENLIELTTYALYIFPYNNVSCSAGPAYNAQYKIQTSFSTPKAPCIGGGENFSNIPASSSTYATRTWTGQNGVTWSATDSRTDQTLNGKAIAVRTGTVKNTIPVTGGMGTLNFSYKRIFTNNSVLKVFVNGTQIGADITVSSDSVMVYSQPVDVEGPVTLELKNSGNRIAIDDISWNCYQAPEGAELQLLDSNLVKKACGALTIDLGSIAVNTNAEATFSIRNLGLQDLDISALTLNDTINYTVVLPEAPFVVDSLGTTDVTIRFNAATAGAKPAVLTISSNDSDEATCTVNFTANALAACTAPLAEGGLAFSNITDTTADAEVTDTPASGYIAVIMPSTGNAIGTPVDGTTYSVGGSLGDGTIVYIGSNPMFAIENLMPDSSYIVAVYAYNNTDCAGGPAYASVYENILETTATPCTGGSETFANIPAAASAYATRTWTGDNGLTWSATDSRTDQTLNGKAIAVKTGTVKNTVAATGGMGTLTFNYARIFTGNSIMKVYVNGVQLGSDITVSADTSTQFTYNVNITGPVTLEITNSGNRIVIDDIAWTCYAGSSAKPGIARETVNSTNDVIVYPNPNKGEFSINAILSGAATVAVFDMQGKSVLNSTVKDGEKVTIPNAIPGIYLVTISDGNLKTTRKIVVE